MAGTHQRVDTKKDAKILAMSAQGASDQQIANKIDIPRSTVQYRKDRMRTEIAEQRKVLLKSDTEDYMDLRSLALYRLREQLTDDEIAAEIPARDLAQVHKEAFNAHQILQNKPTDISGVPGTDIKGREDIDRIAISEEFNKNFKKLQLAAIMGETIEAEEGDFVECPPE